MNSDVMKLIHDFENNSFCAGWHAGRGNYERYRQYNQEGKLMLDEIFNKLKQTKEPRDV